MPFRRIFLRSTERAKAQKVSQSSITAELPVVTVRLGVSDHQLLPGDLGSGGEEGTLGLNLWGFMALPTYTHDLGNHIPPPYLLFPGGDDTSFSSYFLLV